MEAAPQFCGSASSADPAPERLVALVVDPSPEQRQIACHALVLAGCTVLEAADSTEALACLREVVPDAIVTAVSMAGPCDGLGLCEIVRARPRLRACAVVVATTRTDPDRLRRIEEAGAGALVTKPYTPAQLAAAVRQAVAATPDPDPAASGGHRDEQSQRTTRAIE